MGLDLFRLGREFVHRAGVLDPVGPLDGADDLEPSALSFRRSFYTFARLVGVVDVELGAFACFVGRDEGDLGVRVGDAGLLEVGFDARLAPLIAGLEDNGDHRARTGAGFGEVVGLDVDCDLGLVFGGVHRQFDMVGGLLFVGLGVDDHGLAGGHESVHAGRGDPDALLTPGHLEPVELGAVEQLAEDVFYLAPDDAWAIVRDRDLVAAGLGGRGRGLEFLDFDLDIRQDARFFAGVQGVVDRFLDRRQEGLAGVVEPEKVPVLGKELGDRDLALLGCHCFGGRARCGRFLGHATLRGGSESGESGMRGKDSGFQARVSALHSFDNEHGFIAHSPDAQVAKRCLRSQANRGQ